jgi:hypothetical protein
MSGHRKRTKTTPTFAPVRPRKAVATQSKRNAAAPAVKFGEPLLSDHLRGDGGAYLSAFKRMAPDRREAEIRAARRHIPPPGAAREQFYDRMAQLEGADNSLRLGHRA